MMKTIIGVLCFFLLSLTAQELIAQRAYFDQLTTANGLPENSAGVIMQDHLGFMWIGTANGLVRYDGIKMTVFQNDAKDPFSLKGSQITCLYEDRQGDIWVGCAGGLYRFERATQRFIACMPKGEDAFNNSRVSSIYQDKKGSIWVVVNNSDGYLLSQYNPKSDTWTKYRHEPNKSEGLVYSLVNNMSATGPYQGCFFEDIRGDIWVVTRESGRVTSKAQLHRYDRAKDIFRPYQFKGISATHPPLEYIKLPRFDRKGMLWVPTNGNGLYHINPVTNDLIAHYRNNPKDSHSITSDSVRTVYEDRSGLLWVCTSYGLDRLDPKTHIFTHFPNVIKNVDKLKNRVFDAYKETADGHIWFLTVNSGIVEYDPKTEQFTYYEGTAKQVGGLGVGKLLSLLVDQSDLIWAGTRGYGLNKQTKMTRFTPFQYPLTQATRIDTTNVMTVYEAPSEPSVLWLGTNTGLDRYDKKTGQLKHYALNMRINIASRNDNFVEGVSCITEDAMGRFWVGTSTGLYQMDRKKGSFTRFGQNPNNGNSLNYNFISSILSARDGSLWIGTIYGLNHFNPQTKQFKYYYQKDTLYTPDLYRFVRSISNKNRRIVAAWHSFAEKDATQTFKLNQPTTVALVAMGVLTNTQKSDFGWIEDLKGHRVWEMEYSRTRFAGANNRMQIETLQLPAGTYKLQYRINNRASALNFNLEVPTPNNPELWGIQVLQLRDGEAGTLNQLSKKWVYAGLSNNVINTLYEDKKERIWIGTANKLNCYDPKTDDFTVYQDALKGIVNSKAIHEAPNGKLWLGDYLNGLFLFDPEKGTAERFTTANGLSHNSVTGIVPDDNGELWISTFNGLSRFNPVTKRFHIYTGANGLKDLVFRRPPFKSSDGDLYFISDQTLYTLAKNQLFDDPYPPKIVLTDIAIFNKKAGIGHNQPLSVDVSIADKITLAHNQNELTISFAALHYNRTAECQYAFKLEPYDNDWIQAGTARQARYTALPPGTYTFTVKAANADGVWDEKGVSIQIIVLPPWWLTWWAYLLYVLAFGLTLRAYIQYRSRKLKEENLVLEGKVQQRTTELEKSLTELKVTQAQLVQKEKLASLGELTAGIAHEIQNPLNFVNNFSEVSAELVDELEEEQQKPHRDTELEAELLGDLKQNLQKINHHGQRASSIVKGMLEHSRASTGQREPTNLNALADEYLRLAYHGLRAKDSRFNVELTTDFDPDLPTVSVVSQDIGRVLLNLFNNAFYATQHKAPQPPNGGLYQPTVWVSTRQLAPPRGVGGLCVEIRVRDNGIGMPESVREKIFQPFFTTKPTGEGTGLGLSLAYDIVTKGHGGTLNVESKEGEGTEFVIQFSIKTI